MVASTSTRFACCVGYIIFVSMTGGGCGTSPRRVEARRSNPGKGSDGEKDVSDASRTYDKYAMKPGRMTHENK